MRADPRREPLATHASFRSTFLRHAAHYVQTDPLSCWGEYHVAQTQVLDELLSLFNYRKHSRYIIISGPLGGGKTTVIRSLSQMLQHTTAYFEVVGADILLEEFNNNGLNMMSKLRRGALAINDYGVVKDEGKHYGYRASPIDQLVFSRHERGLVTFFSTNLNRDDFFNNWSQRVRDRIESKYSWVTWTPGYNYRKSKNLQK